MKLQRFFKIWSLSFGTVDNSNEDCHRSKSSRDIFSIKFPSNLNVITLEVCRVRWTKFPKAVLSQNSLRSSAAVSRISNFTDGYITWTALRIFVCIDWYRKNLKFIKNFKSSFNYPLKSTWMIESFFMKFIFQFQFRWLRHLPQHSSSSRKPYHHPKTDFYC